MFLIYCLEHASRLADEQRECTRCATVQHTQMLVKCMLHGIGSLPCSCCVRRAAVTRSLCGCLVTCATAALTTSVALRSY
jgi:hypothetical protein